MADMQLGGLAVMLAIALLVMLVVLRRQPRPIWLFALALIALGLGYLATTPAPAEFAAMFFGPPASSTDVPR